MIGANDSCTRNHLSIILGSAPHEPCSYFKSLNYARIIPQTYCGQMYPTGQVREDARTSEELIPLELR
jgi:hypothetical protein